jgi:hypothetical protein
MNRFSILVCVAFVIVSVGTAQDDAAKGPITYPELYKRGVVGRLGVPLGTAVEIKAEVVSGDTTRRKVLRGVYLLKVTHVDGKELASPPLMQYTVPFGGIEIPNCPRNSFFEGPRDAEAERIESARIAKLERSYVGKVVRLVAYERGCFDGIPERLPDDVPLWQGSGFAFGPSLAVLAERGSKSGKRSNEP